MALHLLKLLPDLGGVDDLRASIEHTARAWGVPEGRAFSIIHPTRTFPTRNEELLDGGSIYWVMKGRILARQLLTSLNRRTPDDGSKPFCAIGVNHEVIAVEPRPCKMFRGWRYLEDDAVPPDLRSSAAAADMPEEMKRELAELGLL